MNVEKLGIASYFCAVFSILFLPLNRPIVLGCCAKALPVFLFIIIHHQKHPQGNRFLLKSVCYKYGGNHTNFEQKSLRWRPAIGLASAGDGGVVHTECALSTLGFFQEPTSPVRRVLLGLSRHIDAREVPNVLPPFPVMPISVHAVFNCWHWWSNIVGCFAIAILHLIYLPCMQYVGVALVTTAQCLCHGFLSWLRADVMVRYTRTNGDQVAASRN